MDSGVYCVVCLGWTPPIKVLQCGHSCCMQCLTGVQIRSPMELQCPTCRSPCFKSTHPYYHRRISNLPTNFALQQALMHIGAIESSQATVLSRSDDSALAEPVSLQQDDDSVQVPLTVASLSETELSSNLSRYYHVEWYTLSSSGESVMDRSARDQSIDGESADSFGHDDLDGGGVDASLTEATSLSNHHDDEGTEPSNRASP